MSSNQDNSSICESSSNEIHPDTIPKDLPSDIIFEILTRTSLETLDACKSVCNEWNHMTRESSFMSLYCRRTNALFGYLIQNIIRCHTVSKFVFPEQNSLSNVGIKNIPYDMRILASSDQGILCCLRLYGKTERYYVGKPATDQWQPLPNPKLRCRTDAVAIMVTRAKPLCYKIVRLSDMGFIRYQYMYKCEIFDSKTWTWTTLKNITWPDSEFIKSNQSISTSNSIYWLTTKGNVLQFHKTKQSFHNISLPELVKNNEIYNYKQLVKYEDRLGLTYITQESNMELWVLQKLQSDSVTWMKKMVVNIQDLQLRVHYPSPLGFYNDETVFMTAADEVIFYNLQDGTFSKEKLDYALRYAREVFQFRSDFEPVDLGRST